MTYDYMKIVARPFILPATNHLNSYGGSLNIFLNMENNELDGKFTQAQITAGYVNQSVDADLGGASDVRIEHFSQLAYGLALRKNFYNAFVFGVNGNMYQYLNGIANVRGVTSTFNQNEISNLNSYDVIYNLPKYSAGAAFDRLFDSGADIYLSYSYAEFYTDVPQHSIILGNTFPISGAVKADLGYNHIITADNAKKDIFKISLGVKF